MSCHPSIGKEMRGDAPSLSFQMHTKCLALVPLPTPKQFVRARCLLAFLHHPRVRPSCCRGHCHCHCHCHCNRHGPGLDGAKTFLGELGSTNQKLAVSCSTSFSRLSHPAYLVHPTPSPLLLPCGQICQAGQRRQGMGVARHGMAWQNLLALLSSLYCGSQVQLPSRWTTRTC